MANPTFTDALSSMRRKAQLSGRPLSKQETAGAVAGMAETASQRLTRGRQLDIQDRGLDIQERGLDEEIKAAKRARSDEKALRKRRWYDPTAWCIIVSVCTAKYAYDANIARRYRDKYLSPLAIAGYYNLAAVVVPLMVMFPKFKAFIKEWLVDRLVDHAEVTFKISKKYKFRTSRAITKCFLLLCSAFAIFPRRKEVIQWHSH